MIEDYTNVLSEEQLLYAMLNVDLAIGMMCSTKTYCLKIVGYSYPDSWVVSSVCYYRKTKVELFEAGLILLRKLPIEEYTMAINNLRKLNIPSSLWYKILEENKASTTIKNPETTMNTTTNTEATAAEVIASTAATPATPASYSRHWAKVKFIGMLLAAAGIGAMVGGYSARRNSAASTAVVDASGATE